MKPFRRSTLSLIAPLVSFVSLAIHPASGQTGDKAAGATSGAKLTVKPLTGPQVLYVSPQGNDASAVRGGSQPFATVAAAITSARAGDTVHLLKGQFSLSGPLTCTKAIALTGEGVGATTVVPDDSAGLWFTAATQLRGINFDTGKNATRDSGRPFVDLSNTSGSTVADCRFHGINAVCISGNATTDAAFANLEFDHVCQAVFIDSSVGRYPARLTFRDCRATSVLTGGFIVHSPHAYTGTDLENLVVGLSSGLDFINCSVKDAPNVMGFEVWHGWTNIHFTRCTAEDCDFGFSVSDCDHATFTSCQAYNCFYLFENAGSHDVSFVGCVADARPTATSPHLQQPVPFGTPVVATNGPSHAVTWIGGALKGAVFHASTGSGISLLGATMSSSTARVQNASDVTIQGCTFNQLTGSAPANNWVVVDCSQRSLSNIVFAGNECIGALPYACMEILGAPNAVDRLEITGNHTDGVYNNTGGFVHNQGVTLTNRFFAGNTTDNPNAVYPGNTCFPNDPY